MLSGPAANLPTRDQFRISANRREAPYLIDLDALAVQVVEGFILVLRACLAKIGKELEHRALGRARHAGRGAGRVPLYQGGYDLRPLLRAQPIHLHPPSSLMYSSCLSGQAMSTSIFCPRYA